MTKQEEIREGITRVLKHYYGDCGMTHSSVAGAIMEREDKLGVVIKDKRYGMGVDTRGGYNWKDTFFVIPLIKEESDGNNEVS